MAGSIRQRGKTSWELTVYVGYDRKSRKRRYESKTFRGSKRDAERRRAKFVTEVNSWMTEMLRRGVGPSQLRVAAGASPEVITRHYDHITEDDAYDSMLRALLAAGSR